MKIREIYESLKRAIGKAKDIDMTTQKNKCFCIEYESGKYTQVRGDDLSLSYRNPETLLVTEEGNRVVAVFHRWVKAYRIDNHDPTTRECRTIAYNGEELYGYAIKEEGQWMVYRKEWEVDGELTFLFLCEEFEQIAALIEVHEEEQEGK